MKLRGLEKGGLLDEYASSSSSFLTHENRIRAFGIGTSKIFVDLSGADGQIVD